MCGIAGIFRPDGGPVQVARVRRMAGAMRHRGPSDEGYVAIDTRGRRAPAVPLAGPRTAPNARVRLSGALCPGSRENDGPGPRRIEPAGSGYRPARDHRSLAGWASAALSTADGQVWVTYGGEIYNYIELRAELQARGHEFTTLASDTEAWAHGWAEGGRGRSSERMNGMWNLALWDARRRHLVLSRDRFGVKPLYTRFRHSGSSPSPPSSAACSRPAAPRPEPHLPALKTLLARGRVDTGREDLLRRDRSLAARYTSRSPVENGLELVRYWNLTGGRRRHRQKKASPPVAAERLLPKRSAALVTDSVRFRLRSDVKVGTCLSGGIDSSTVVALSTRLLGGGPVDAYSVAYDEGPAFDERPYMASSLCRETGARHHLVVPRGEDLLAELEAVTVAQEKPRPAPGSIRSGR